MEPLYNCWWECKLQSLRKTVCVCIHACSVISDSCNPMDCRPPGSFVHGIFQERILEWIAISYSKRSSQPRIKPASLESPALAGGFYTHSATWEVQKTVWHFFRKKKQMLKTELPYDPANHFRIYIQRKRNHYLEEIPVFPCYCSIIKSSQDT